MKQYQNPQIHRFLKRVKEELPDWATEKKDDLYDILDQLEEHILDKACAIANSENPDFNSINLAIKEIGSPKKIAQEYKKRGTPKVYITEELWPYYTKTLGIVLGVVITLNIVGNVIDIVIGGDFNWGGIFGGFFSSLMGITLVISAIFVGLSMEGFLPENLGIKTENATISSDQGKSTHSGESKYCSHTKSKWYKPGEFLFGGIFQIIFGMIFMSQPEFNIFPEFSPEFRTLISIWGLILIIKGGLDLSRVPVSRRNVPAHQGFMIGTFVMEVLDFVTLVYLMKNPAIFPWVIPGWIFTVLVVLTALGFIDKIRQIVMLPSKAAAELEY